MKRQKVSDERVEDTMKGTLRCCKKRFLLKAGVSVDSDVCR